MKTLTFTAILLLFSGMLYSQVKAVTETGDEVVLYKDGRWAYVNAPPDGNREIAVNETMFSKNAASTFLVKSNKVNIGVWINPKDWIFSKGAENEDAEYSFQKRDDDLYALLLTEKTPIPLETLKDIALENAKKVAADAMITSEEYRNVNGLKILMLKMSATIQGIRISYMGYYYSNANGTIQFLTYTGENLAESFSPDIENLLNGLAEL
ncbi:MAG TPA: hypothetical protein VK155_01290 [Bacteroidales bacterium]|nr:hypothetical protein [Bacteroidales bacterium]